MYTVLTPRTVQDATVATLETTASTTYVDLATVGPTITMNTNTRVLAIWAAQMFNNTATNSARMSVAVSGATTIAATTDNASIVTAGTSGDAFQIVGSTKFNLNAGSNTFTAKYSASATTANFQRRRLIIIPLPS